MQSKSQNNYLFQELRIELMTSTPTGHVAHMKAVSSEYTIFIVMRAARRIGCRLEVLKEFLAKMWTEFS
jgi:hypothetical protein